MPTPPPNITALPTAPSRDDSVNFSARADAFVAALPPFGVETNAVAANLYSNALEAETNATTAITQAGNASTFANQAANSAILSAQNAGAAAWVSGTTYAAGAVVYSPIDFNVYRRRSAGGGTTDPSADATNWAVAGPATPQMISSASSTLTAQVNTHVILIGAVQQTISVPSSPANGDVFTVTVANGRVDNVVGRNSQNIMGLAEDMTLDTDSSSVTLRYVGATLGWRIV